MDIQLAIRMTAIKGIIEWIDEKVKELLILHRDKTSDKEDRYFYGISIGVYEEVKQKLKELYKKDLEELNKERKDTWLDGYKASFIPELQKDLEEAVRKK